MADSYLLIRGATVYDGSGSPGVVQDVAVRGERIAAVGDAATRLGGTNVVDAHGLALAPGFIAMHSHSDHTLPANADGVGHHARSTSRSVGPGRLGHEQRTGVRARPVR